MTSPFFTPTLLLALICTSMAPVPAPAGQTTEAMLFDDSAIETKEIPSWFKASFLDLGEDLTEATDNGKQGLMLFFDTDGCAYCKAFLKHTLGDPEIQADVRTHFDVIHLNMFSDVEVTDFSGHTMPTNQFARREGATVSPTIVFYGSDGDMLHRTVGYSPPKGFRPVLDYVVDGHYATQDFRRYSAGAHPPTGSRHPRPVEDPLFEDDPFLLDRSNLAAQRPLMVLFEAADCEECRQFQAQVLTHAPVRRLLNRFDAVRFDWADAGTPVVTPSGEKSNPAAWAEELALSRAPALLFFDEAGNEVFRLESLVLRQRMERALLYVLEKAYLEGMTYQQFTRQKTIESLKREGAADTEAG